MEQITLHEKIVKFQKMMLIYGEAHGRSDLPWRLTRDPWKLLLAEILLRKTTSRQAVEVYMHIQELTPSDIVRMPLAELEHLLQPIGLGRVRAAGLKDAAARLVDVPVERYRDDDFLRSLPGVGRYISNSVRCCAFDEPVPALDTNMIRIIQRVFGWVSKRSRPREDRELWAFAGTIVPITRAREFNWATLDFGAAVCTASYPKCGNCLLNDICTYFQRQRYVAGACEQ
jgi:A/G-specific adenine glycosylase